MSFKRYRIIFILIFLILCWDGTYVDASEETTKQQQHVTNDLENAQSGELFTFYLFFSLHATPRISHARFAFNGRRKKS